MVRKGGLRVDWLLWPSLTVPAPPPCRPHPPEYIIPPPRPGDSLEGPLHPARNTPLAAVSDWGPPEKVGVLGPESWDSTGAGRDREIPPGGPHPHLGRGASSGGALGRGAPHPFAVPAGHPQLSGLPPLTCWDATSPLEVGLAKPFGVLPPAPRLLEGPTSSQHRGAAGGRWFCRLGGGKNKK